MAHHYKTHCNNCYRYQTCRAEAYNISLSEKRSDSARERGAPFVPYNPDSREMFRKQWEQNGRVDVEDNDCYMTKKDYLKHIQNNKN